MLLCGYPQFVVATLCQALPLFWGPPGLTPTPYVVQQNLTEGFLLINNGYPHKSTIQ
jgi:hypothetical protein